MSEDVDAATASRRLEDTGEPGTAAEGRSVGPDVTGDVGGTEAAGVRVATRYFELVESVLAAETHSEAEQALCEGLVAADRYRSVWVAERTLSADRLTVRSVGVHGAVQDHRDAVEPPTVRADGATPWAGALAQGELRVGVSEPSGPHPWEEDDRTRDPEAVAAVPLDDGGAVDGVLVVHASGEESLAPIERRGLRSLGSALARACDAIRTRELLDTDAVVELEVRHEPGDSPLTAAASEHGCRLDLAGHTATGDGWLLYCDVEGAAAGAVATTLATTDGIDRCRALVEGTEGGRVEVATAGGSLVERATDTGTTVVDLTVDGGVCRVTLEVPRSAETRPAVAWLRQSFPDLELVSCRERERSATEPTAAAGVLDGLTDRQREILETLYHSGYFEWPRESTAEDVADQPDVVPGTLQGHLRKAQNHVLSALLD